MYTSSSGEAPSAAAALNGRESAFSMPSDHTTALWERQAIGRDKFDRERYTSTKREWTVENRSSYRSSSVISASGSLSASFNKRRAIGRHETVVENGRYRNSVGRLSDSSTSLRSPPQIGKAERDMCSPGYGGSPIVERPSKAQDGHHYRETHLSPGTARPLSSPRFDSRLHGNQNDSEGVGLWDRERSRFSSPPYTWDAPNRGRDYRERAWSRPDYRRACPLPKIDSSREWSQSDRELLEGRIDRYSSVSGRETGFSDVLSANSREHTRHDWRGRDRISQCGISSQIPAYPSTSSLYNRDSKNASFPLEAPGVVSSPQHSPMQSSFSHESDQDCGPSTKKRPRLTWGQGLAKYEKEKTGEDFSPPKKSEEGSSHVGGLHSDGSVASALLDGSLQTSNVLLCLENRHPCEEQARNADTWAGAGIQKEATPLSCQDSGVCLNEKEPSMEARTERKEGNANALINVSCNVETGSFELAVAETADSQSSVLQYMQSFLHWYQQELPNLSKEVLTLNVEKVEFEIDRLEKEIAKIETVHDVDTLISEEEAEAAQLESKCEGSLGLKVHEGVSKPSSSPLSVHSIGLIPLVTSARMISSVDAEGPGATVLDTELPVPDSVDEQEVKNAVVHHIVAEGGVKEQSVLFNFDDSSDIPPRLRKEEGVSADLKMSKLFKKDLRDFIASFLVLNQEIAEHSSNALAHLVGEKNRGVGMPCRSLQESSVGRRIVDTHDRTKGLLEVKVTEERRLRRFAEGVLAVKYRAKKEAWKQEQSGSFRWKDRDKCFGIWDPEMKSGNTTPGRQSPSQISPFTSSSFVPDVNNEGMQAAKGFVTESPVAIKREYLRMPPMVLGQKERFSHKFETKNALVEDPVAAEQERKVVNPWSVEERRIFLDKYSLLGKNLRKIASFLEHKTVADCVQFYYQNQKTEEFEKIHRRHQLKKRRDCRASALYLATTTSVSSRHREENAAFVGGLSLVAAAAAAMSVPRDLSRPVRSPVMKLCPFGGSSSKTYQDSTLVRQASSASTLTGKDSNVEHLAGKCAQNTHSRSLKRPPEEVLQWRSQWNDQERDLFIKAVAAHGKDFDRISSYIGTKSLGQCKTYFSKARKRLGLDQLVERHAALLENKQRDEILPIENQNKNAHLHINGYEFDSDFKMGGTLFEQQSKGERSPLQVNSCMASEIRCNSPHENQEVISALSCPKPFQAADCTGSTLLGGNPGVQSVDNPWNQGLFSHSPGRTRNVDVSVNFLKSGVSPVNGFQVCSNDTTEEASQIKKEPSILKGEASPGSHISTGVSKISSSGIHGTSSSTMVSALVPGSHTAASVNQTPQVKEKGIKTTEVKARREPTSWTQEEKEKFIEVLKAHGKNWDLLCKSLPAKSLIQIKTYFQNSKAKRGLGSDGVIINPGRAGSSWKRKVDDSDSSSNTGSAGQMMSQKAAVPSDDGSLKASTSILASAGGSGSNLPAEALAYANVFGRKFLEESINAQKVFHATGLPQNPSSPGILPMLTTPVFSQPNLVSAQQPYMHTASTSMKIPQIVNHQQSEQSLSSLMVVEPSSSVGLHQTHLLQPQQQMTQDPTLQSAHKHSLQVDQKALLQHILPPSQQLQQMAEAVLQQLLPQAVQRHQQQVQLAAQQAPHYFQQVLNHQSNWQSSQTSAGNVPVSMGTGQQKQQQSVLSQAQLHQMHGKVQALLQQHQQVPQLNQLQLLQLQRQQQQQQQLLIHLQQQAQALSQSQQIQIQTSLMQQSHNLSNEQQQQGFFRGFMQSSNIGGIEGSKQNEFDMSTLSKFQQGDVHQPLVLNQTLEVSGKPQMVSEHSPAGDVKLFGQSLLSQPASVSPQLNAKIPSSLPAVSASSACISAATIATNTPGKVSWDHVIQGQGGQQITRPNAFINGGLTCTISKGTGDSNNLQEIVSGPNERIKRETRDINSGKIVDCNYVAHVPQMSDGSVYTHMQTSLDNCTIHTSTSLSCGPSIESLRCEDNEKGRPGQVANVEHPNVNKKQELNSVPGSSGGEAVASQGLPRVLDALVALAEWRLQNSSGCSGKLTDEFLSHSWEALQKDPGSLIEAGKASGSLSQLCSEGPQMLQHLRERLVSSHSGLMQVNPGSGSILGSTLENAAPLSDGQNVLSQATPLHINVCDPGRSDCLTTEANGGGVSNG